MAELSPEPVVFGSSPLCSLRGFAKTAAAVFSKGEARERAHGEAERAGRTAWTRSPQKTEINSDFFVFGK